MGALTEPEIFAYLAENARLAAEAADDLAVRCKRGKTYRDLRDHLANIEGACRQAGHWRGDARFFDIGLMCEEAHKRAGGWLRGVKDPVTGKRTPIPAGQKHPLFVKLAEVLRSLLKSAQTLETAATKQNGPVLPETPRETRRLGAPVPGYNFRKSGLIVPDGVTVQ